jgi:serine/threonine-protein kinase
VRRADVHRAGPHPRALAGVAATDRSGKLADGAVTTSASPPNTAAPLGRVGGYELVLELAAGGMATVYLARAIDGRMGAPLVGLKRPHRHLATDKTFLSMLIDEARLASTIEHPNVVKVRELGFEGGEPFIVMDYVEGASLAELRKELSNVGRALDVRIAVRVILDALAGLHAAHEQRDESGKHLGIIHRDVSPHNVLIGCDGRGRLTDFGIAKAEDRVQITRTHEVKGKLAYLAPERVDKRRLCTVQSDLFSMGVVLWECIAGRRLFRGDEAIDTLQEVMNAPIPKLRQIGAQVPALLDDVIARALSRDLDVRYRTAAEFAQAVERAVRGNVATADEVAKVMEAVFGQRMAARHERVREALAGVDVDALFANTGLKLRERPTSTSRIASESAIAHLAPLAPSSRYTFGAVSEDFAKLREKQARLRMLSGVAFGVAFGALVAFGIVAFRGGDAEDAEARAEAPPPSRPSTRRVVVPLPFVATTVTLGDAVRTLDPASDVGVFDVPIDTDVRHRLIVVGADGARAEGIVLEADGVARVDKDGFLTVYPSTASSAASANGAAGTASGTGAPAARPMKSAAQPPSKVAKPKAPAHPVGTTRNGFTKLQ